MTILDNNTESANLLNVQPDEWSGVSSESLPISMEPLARGWRVASLPANGRKCEGCSIPLTGTGKRFCSRQCQQSVDRPGAHMPRKIKDRPCQQCGKVFRPRETKYPGKYCSNECTYAARRKPEIITCDRPLEPTACAECGSLYERASKKQITCSRDCGMRRSIRMRSMQMNPERYEAKPCLECGKVFTPVYGERAWGRCSPECKEKARARAAKKQHRIGKAKRRAIERGAEADSIDPIKVFERDGWRCQLCGRKTPKALRGKHQPSSPELDHIVPLSRGGPHTYANTQCACRECNGNKGASILGQLNFNL